MSNFEPCFQHIIEVEGGYSNRAEDLGGPTKWGITHRTLSSYLGRRVTAADVKAMSTDTAKSIYRYEFWNAMKLDGLSFPLACTLFDIGVNRGPRTAIIELQLVLGANPDGDLGPKTRSLIARHDERTLIWRFLKEVLRDYVKIAQNRPSQLANLGGWTNRVLHLTSLFVAP